MKRILLIGENEDLLRSRAALLAKYHANIVMSTPTDLVSAVGDRPFDVVVLCHSLTGTTAESVAIGARKRWQNTRILQLVRYDFEKSESLHHADAVASSERPDEVVDAVRGAFERQRKPAKRWMTARR